MRADVEDESSSNPEGLELLAGGRVERHHRIPRMMARASRRDASLASDVPPKPRVSAIVPPMGSRNPERHAGNNPGLSIFRIELESGFQC